MDHADSPEQIDAASTLEWTAQVPLVSASERGSWREEGSALGMAVCITVLIAASVLAGTLVFRGFAWIMGGMAAIGTAVFWLVRFRPQPASEMVNAWPVLFILHELGAEAIAKGDPPLSVATPLHAQLRSQAMSRSFWSGLRGGLFSGLWAYFSRSSSDVSPSYPNDSGPVTFSLSMSWNRVIAISLDERAMIIDLTEADRAGLRLHCTLETFGAACSFIRRHVHRVLLELPHPGSTGHAS